MSSYKETNGLTELLNDNLNTFWQTDSNDNKNLHYLELNFNRTARVSEIWIYLDHKKDESYCPSHILIKMANCFGELMDVKKVLFESPQGWYKIQIVETDKEIQQDPRIK